MSRPKDTYCFLPSGAPVDETAIKILKIVFEGQTVRFDLERLMRIDPENIEGSIIDHTEMFGWWVSCRASVERNLSSESRELEFLTDRLASEFNAVSPRSPEYQTALYRYTSQDPRVRELKTRVSDLAGLKALADSFLTAFEHKRSMLECLARLKNRT